MGESAAVPWAPSQRLCRTNTAHLALCLQPPVEKVSLYFKWFRWEQCLKETGKWLWNLVEASVRSQRAVFLRTVIVLFLCDILFCLHYPRFFLSFLWGAESENIHTWWFFLIFRAVPLTLHITAERILGVTCDPSRFLGVVWGGGARENGNNPQVLLYSHHLPLIGGRWGAGKYLIGWAESLNIQQFFFDLK